MIFIGREHELESLQRLFSRKTASLVVCKGRRRIGKSTLIQHFGRSAGNFLEFQGLAPEEKIGKKEQLENFCSRLAKQTRLPKVQVNDWDQAFSLLNSAITSARTVVLLDEISWMATGSPALHAQLKAAWDMEFKLHPNLVMVVCGSSSSWIEKNIIQNTGFVGRVSLEITLQELSLPYCNRFWGKKNVSFFEKLQLLSVTGGVPRYLEEIDPSLPAEENVRDMCFTRGGFLFSEFPKIFNDIFDRRSAVYRRILHALIDGRKSFSDLCRGAGLPRGGSIAEYVDDLVESGFVAGDRIFDPTTGKRTNREHYRIRDNYVRFYLKYIEPLSDKVRQGIYDRVPAGRFVAWDTVMGLQFENLVLNNLGLVLDRLRIDSASIVAASPYSHRATNLKRGVQIDLLIRTKNAIYPCEIKLSKDVDVGVIAEVKKKVAVLDIPPLTSVRPVLIYAGELAPGVGNEDYFDRIVHFKDLLENAAGA